MNEQGQHRFGEPRFYLGDVFDRSAVRFYGNDSVERRTRLYTYLFDARKSPKKTNSFIQNSLVRLSKKCFLGRHSLFIISSCSFFVNMKISATIVAVFFTLRILTDARASGGRGMASAEAIAPEMPNWRRGFAETKISVANPSRFAASDYAEAGPIRRTDSRTARSLPILRASRCHWAVM